MISNTEKRREMIVNITALGLDQEVQKTNKCGNFRSSIYFLSHVHLKPIHIYEQQQKNIQRKTTITIINVQ